MRSSSVVSISILILMMALAFHQSHFIQIGTGIPTITDKALIIVATKDTTHQHEYEKADAYYTYLIDQGYQTSNIDYLACSKASFSDHIDNYTNIRNAFDRLIEDSDQNTRVSIYVSDSIHPSSSISTFHFHDCNITDHQISNWIDDITCYELIFITFGNHSGSIGNSLSGDRRYILSSMTEDEDNSPDEFNITRSLKDLNSDLNQDAIVTYVEAFYRGKSYYLVRCDQDPQITIN